MIQTIKCGICKERIRNHGNKLYAKLLEHIKLNHPAHHKDLVIAEERHKHSQTDLITLKSRFGFFSTSK